MSSSSRRASCPKAKRSYATEADAEVALERIRNLPVRPGYPARTVKRSYQCPWCMEWHLTSNPEGRE